MRARAWRRHTARALSAATCSAAGFCAPYNSASKSAYATTGVVAGSPFYAKCPITLVAGQLLQFGFAGFAGTRSTGNVQLFLVASSSKSQTVLASTSTATSYVVPSNGGGKYYILEGCATGSSCSGKSAYSINTPVLASGAPVPAAQLQEAQTALVLESLSPLAQATVSAPQVAPAPAPAAAVDTLAAAPQEAVQNLLAAGMPSKTSSDAAALPPTASIVAAAQTAADQVTQSTPASTVAAVQQAIAAAQTQQAAAQLATTLLAPPTPAATIAAMEQAQAAVQTQQAASLAASVATVTQAAAALKQLAAAQAATPVEVAPQAPPAPQFVPASALPLLQQQQAATQVALSAAVVAQASKPSLPPTPTQLAVQAAQTTALAAALTKVAAAEQAPAVQVIPAPAPKPVVVTSGTCQAFDAATSTLQTRTSQGSFIYASCGPVQLSEGQVVVFGLHNVPGASYRGNAMSFLVPSGDRSNILTSGDSALMWTAQKGQAGTYTILEGCGPTQGGAKPTCSGQVAWAITTLSPPPPPSPGPPPPPPSPSPPPPRAPNAPISMTGTCAPYSSTQGSVGVVYFGNQRLTAYKICTVYVPTGFTLTYGTGGGLSGAAYTGYTALVLENFQSEKVNYAINDKNHGGGMIGTYTALQSDSYSQFAIIESCAYPTGRFAGPCSGTVAWKLTAPSATAPSPALTVPEKTYPKWSGAYGESSCAELFTSLYGCPGCGSAVYAGFPGVRSMYDIPVLESYSSATGSSTRSYSVAQVMCVGDDPTTSPRFVGAVSVPGKGLVPACYNWQGTLCAPGVPNCPCITTLPVVQTDGIPYLPQQTQVQYAGNRFVGSAWEGANQCMVCNNVAVPPVSAAQVAAITAAATAQPAVTQPAQQAVMQPAAVPAPVATATATMIAVSNGAYTNAGPNLDCSGADLQQCYGYGQYSIAGQGTYAFCAQSCDACAGCTGFGISNNGCWLKATTGTYQLSNSQCWLKSSPAATTTVAQTKTTTTVATTIKAAPVPLPSPSPSPPPPTVYTSTRVHIGHDHFENMLMGMGHFNPHPKNFGASSTSTETTADGYKNTFVTTTTTDVNVKGTGKGHKNAETQTTTSTEVSHPVTKTVYNSPPPSPSPPPMVYTSQKLRVGHEHFDNLVIGTGMFNPHPQNYGATSTSTETTASGYKNTYLTTSTTDASVKGTGKGHNMAEEHTTTDTATHHPITKTIHNLPPPSPRPPPPPPPSPSPPPPPPPPSPRALAPPPLVGLPPAALSLASCPSFGQNGWTYSLCYPKAVTQSQTTRNWLGISSTTTYSLGTPTWNTNGYYELTGGSSCGNAGSRSGRMYMVCNQLQSQTTAYVTEPQTCKYNVGALCPFA